MPTIEQIQIAPFPLERFAEVITPEQQAEFDLTVAKGRELLDGRVVWSVNSTQYGGGVAELLRSLVSYARAGGVDARWVVAGAEPDFFRVTKRIHNRLHGWPGDGGPLGAAERAIYERTAQGAVGELKALVKPGDIVLLHDPQTAGLTQSLLEHGALVVWRAHIGLDLPNDYAREAWAFLLPYVLPAHAYVFSRGAYAWDQLDPERVSVIAPSIDPFAAKNEQLDPSQVRAIMGASGLIAGRWDGAPTFDRHDGSPGRVDRTVQLIEDERLSPDAQIVTQVSRWDRIKDPQGVMEAFAEHVVPQSDAHLVLAGPDTSAVADDPEGAEVLELCVERWRALEPEARTRIHLALLPMNDAEENAVVVNALQRWSTVVVQKSLAEGFGLTVTEAMWKARPVVAGRVGGIQDQIQDGESGLLVDPANLGEFGAAVLGLLRDPGRAARLGAAAQDRVRAQFLGVRHLTQYVELFEQLIVAASY